MLLSGAFSLCVFAFSPAPPSSPTSVAPAQTQRVLSRYEMQIVDRPTMEKIGHKFSIEGRRGNIVSVYVYEDQAADFLALAPNATLLARDNDAWMRGLSREDTAGYLTYDDWAAKLSEYEAKYLDLIELIHLDYMKSTSGKEIMIMKLSGDVALDNPKKPVLAFSAATHGDEWSSTAAGMGVLEQMLADYGTDSQVTKMIDWTTSYWIPIISPDSFQMSRNVDGVDPNRVYPYPDEPDLDGEVTHAQAVLKFYREIKPVASIDFHAVVGAVLWPWGYTTEKVDPEDWAHFNDLGAKMAMPSGYESYQASQLYPAPGSDDSWYYQFKTTSFTVEMGGSSKKPSESDLDGLTEDARGAVYALMNAMLPAVDPNEDDSSDETSSNTNDSQSSSADQTGSDGTTDTNTTAASTEQGDTTDTSLPSNDESKSSTASDSTDENLDSADQSASTGVSSDNGSNGQDSDKNGSSSSGCASTGSSRPVAVGLLLVASWSAWRRRRRSRRA